MFIYVLTVICRFIVVLFTMNARDRVFNFSPIDKWCKLVQIMALFRNLVRDKESRSPVAENLVIPAPPPPKKRDEGERWEPSC